MIGAESSCLTAFGSIFLVSDIYGGVHIVNVLLVQLIPQELYSLSKPLEMDDFSLPQELDRIIHIRIIADTQDIIIGRPGLLLWYDHLKPTKIKLYYDGTSHFHSVCASMAF